MPRLSTVDALSRTAAATTIATLETKSLYATDRSDSRPLAAANAKRVVPNPRTIAVGSVERLAHGELRCFAEGTRVVVELRRGRKRVGRALSIEAPPALRVEGAEVPEAAFSAEVNEFIGSPWHELEYTSLWTVHGLREKGEAETFFDR